VVEVRITEAAESAERVWTLAFVGRDAFASQDRRLTLRLPAAATPAEIRAGLARVFRLGIAEYAVRSDVGSQLDVTIAAAPDAGAAGAAPAEHDPWDHWVFRLSTYSSRNGEVSSASSYFSGSASASRITEAWKLNVSTDSSHSTSRFDLDETESVLTDENSWSVNSLVVKSLTGHWSLGLTGGASSSTYSNQKLTATVNPAVEYDLFPYAESSQRSLTFQYAIGATYYQYRELTIFDKLEETKPRHSLTISLGLRQPWGTAGASASFSQILNAPEQNRLSVNGSINVRVFKGLTVNGSASYSRIRDQFYLEKSFATEEEILLRLRQLATGYYASASVGFTYSFGSLGNASVNPRFGG
jgi:hypothetical protein